jgi:hypothetical protein
MGLPRTLLLCRRLFLRDPDFAVKAGRVLDLYERVWEDIPLGINDFVISADEKPVFKPAAANSRLCRRLPLAPCESSTSTFVKALGPLLGSVGLASRQGPRPL